MANRINLNATSYHGADAFDKYMENYNATMQSKDKADRIAGNVAADALCQAPRNADRYVCEAIQCFPKEVSCP